MFESCNLESYKEATMTRFRCIADNGFSQILDEIPPEWDCNEKDRKALGLYLQKRFSVYNKMLSLILEAGKAKA
jgi:hypothetical protein